MKTTFEKECRDLISDKKRERNFTVRAREQLWTAAHGQIKRSLACLYQLFFEMSTPSAIDQIIFIIASWCLSAVHTRMFVIMRNDRSHPDEHLLGMLLQSHISWNAGSSLISGSSKCFFNNITTTVGFALEQKSSLEQLIAYVNMSIAQANNFR